VYLRGVALATDHAFPNCSSLRPAGQNPQSLFGETTGFCARDDPVRRRVFHVSSSSANGTLDNLVIEGGQANVTGGGIEDVGRLSPASLALMGATLSTSGMNNPG
jgi:hypothetical protein